jgi:hypothetical protein
VLILVLGLRKGEALGLIEPDDDWRTDEDRAVIDLEWQLQRVGGHPLTHKQVNRRCGQRCCTSLLYAACKRGPSKLTGTSLLPDNSE